jgi:hypothetical protein
MAVVAPVAAMVALIDCVGRPGARRLLHPSEIKLEPPKSSTPIPVMVTCSFSETTGSLKL